MLMSNRFIFGGLLAAFGAGLVAGVAGDFHGLRVTKGARASESFAMGSRPEVAAPTGTVDQTVTLTDQQLAFVRVAQVEERAFPQQRSAIGSIDFNQDMAVQVFTPYQGRVLSVPVKVGDDVAKGQTLFTVDSPDLLQAESTLISSAAALELQTRTLNRARELFQSRAISQRELEQAISDQQSAEAAHRAARNAVRIFGKTDDDIAKAIESRQVDSSLVVVSPIAGRVTVRNAAPGLFLQPGNAPAPIVVADISTMWMIANVLEGDSTLMRVGQNAAVTVNAWPGRTLSGRITTIGSSVDPATRRVTIRSDISDPEHILRAGMFANFIIQVGAPIRSPAIPVDGIVREGDGSMSAWTTKDRRAFTRRSVKVGAERDGFRQILDGLQPGETVATEGALFLSNALAIR